MLVGLESTQMSIRELPPLPSNADVGLANARACVREARSDPKLQPVMLEPGADLLAPLATAGQGDSSHVSQLPTMLEPSAGLNHSNLSSPSTSSEAGDAPVCGDTKVQRLGIPSSLASEMDAVRTSLLSTLREHGDDDEEAHQLLQELSCLHAEVVADAARRSERRRRKQ